jgi:hypothetical protein
MLEKAEVADLAGAGRRAPAGELTAYFCVSRTRMVLRHLLAIPETEAKKVNESSGSFFLWSES